MVLGFEGYILLPFAGGGNRDCQGGKDATFFDGTVFSFLFRVGVNPFVGLWAVVSWSALWLFSPDIDLLLEWEATEGECLKHLEYLEEAEELLEHDLLDCQPVSTCMA